ncbi:MAG: M12 family metallo-peptidase, partial [Saprospiraceae bacterium]
MVIRLRSMGLLLSAALILVSQHLLAQSFTGALQATFTAPELASTLTTYEVYRIDANQVDQYARKLPNGGTYTFQLGSRQWALALEPSGVVAANYALQTGADKSAVDASTMPPTTWQGFEKTGYGKVRLTFAEEFIYGYVEQGGERWYIQPVWHMVPGADRDLFVVYPESGVVDTYGGSCAVLEEQKVHEEYLKDVIQEQLEAAEAKSLACYEVALALASDNSMLTKYGSIGSLQARNAGVINDVEGDYASGNFNHDVQFNIVIQFVPAGNDPWSNSTDPGVLLNSFTVWGNNGGFGVQYDLAQLWTNRNLDGSVIGIAWLNGICNSNRYSVCQDFSNNADLIRVLTSHEFGHNFSLVHDNNCPPPNYIMCPSVSNTMQWSTQSINTMNSKLTSLINNGCISPCGANPPLEANFEWNPDPACQGESIQFTDLSVGNITSRAWTFPSGNPAT